MGPLRHLFLFNADTWEKMMEFIVDEFSGEKPSFSFSNLVSISPKQLPQNQDCKRKNEKLKKWGSKMDLILPTGGTCEKNERFFCSSTHSEQQPLLVFLNSSPFSQNVFGKRLVKKR
jgi:hypothetical protein